MDANRNAWMRSDRLYRPSRLNTNSGLDTGKIGLRVSEDIRQSGGSLVGIRRPKVFLDKQRERGGFKSRGSGEPGRPSDTKHHGER